MKWYSRWHRRRPRRRRRPMPETKRVNKNDTRAATVQGEQTATVQEGGDPKRINPKNKKKAKMLNDMRSSHNKDGMEN